jgi:type III pantothenate kinase
MNLVIDYGNTRGKAALFDAEVLIEKKYFQANNELLEWLNQKMIDHVLISSVKGKGDEILTNLGQTGKSFQLSSRLPLPVQLQYLSPDTLGVDRIAAVCGAVQVFPQNPVLVVDAGTCVNYEFVSEDRIYFGGAISPGLRMRFESVHHFTARLPLVAPKSDPELTGRTTEECIQSGIQIGLVEEINGIISRYHAKYPKLKVILCGGDWAFFENYLKPTIFVAPDLVLMGLNRILQHNVSN